MKFIKRALGDFHKISYEITRSVRFWLSYDPFKLDFIVFNVDIMSTENKRCHGRRYDVICTRQNVM